MLWLVSGQALNPEIVGLERFVVVNYWAEPPVAAAGEVTLGLVVVFDPYYVYCTTTISKIAEP